MTPVQELDSLNCPLRGLFLIEAAAGTGKTYNIQNLVVRAVLERDIPIEKLLVVTYTRAAAAELAGRIRQVLSGTLAALEKRLPPESGREAQLVARALETLTSEECRKRLRTALFDFDAATVTTIHGFCQKVLRENAFESGILFSRELDNDCAELLEKLADDLYRREFYPDDDARHSALRQALLRQAGYTAERLAELALRRIARPDLVIRSNAEAGTDPAADLEELAEGFGELRREELPECLANFPYLFNKPFSGKDFDRFIAAYEKFRADGVPTGEFLQLLAAFTPEALTEALCARKKSGAPSQFAALEQRQEALAGILEQPESQRIFRLAELAPRFGDTVLLAAVEELLAAYDRAKQQANLQTFDDMIRDVHRALMEPESRLQRSLQQQYPLGIVDEFQDTDPIQYAIFKKIFIDPAEPGGAAPAATLFLVGDPRQAIYGFRGGDIDTYNRAADDVFRYGGAKYTLTRNFRSAAGMIEAVNLLFSRHASPFASERITLPEISAPAKPELGNRPESALLVAGREDRRPLRITDLPDSDGDACLAAAVEIANALLCDDTLHIPPRGDTPERRLRPGDIAILVKKWSEAYALKPLLAARMIPSVFSNSESVYRSDEARELLTVLAAIAAPERSGEVLAALATGLGGCGLAELLRLGSEEGSNELAEHQTAFARLRREWRPETFIVMFSGLLKYFDIPARFARQEGGERKLANLHQLGDLLQQESSRRKLSINALLNFLSDAVEGRIDDSSDEVKQILESDRDSVKITTVHSSKGLEYPVVILPSLFRFATGSRSPGGNFHEDGHLVYELHAAGSMNEREHDEATMENLRLAYVALTRAKYRCHVLWGKDGASSYCNSPLDWLVKFREATPEEAAHPTRFLKMRKDAPRLLPVELEEKKLPVSTQVYRPELDRSRQLAPWEWNHRVLRDHYRIASFSSLSPAASGRLDPADDGADHDDSQPEEQLPALPETAPEKNPALALPGGKAFGNAVHEILEELDFTAPIDALRELAARKLRFYGLLSGDGSGADRERLDAVAAMVERTRRAPLHDAQGDGFTLSQIGRADRLSELRFLFGFGQKFRTGEIAELLGDYAEREFRFTDWPEWNTPVDGGFLNGFIDLVFRRRTASGDRYCLVDWKTNRLDGEPANFTPARLPAAMSHSYYFLQYLFYTVALVKFLRRTFGKFDAEDYRDRFGGVYYLFLRGIRAGQSPNGDGVFFTRPDFELVTALEALISPEEP